MLTYAICFSLHFGYMGFYEDRPPPHGHRTPSELAEDAILSALRGDFCGMPARLEGRDTKEPKEKSDPRLRTAASVFSPTGMPLETTLI